MNTLVISFRLAEGLLISLNLASIVVVLALMFGAIIVVFAKKLDSALIVVGGAVIGAFLKVFFL